MRALVDRPRIEQVMAALARAATLPVRVYLVGGTTAVLVGWRSTTVDIDFVCRPEDDGLLRALPRLKDDLSVNLELASPLDFIPVPPGWEERSPLISRIAPASFHHFDPYAQAMAKLERGHAKDLGDVTELVARGLVEPAKALAYFEQLWPELYRFPAIDPPTFRRAVEREFSRH
jgi:hypothetical protein